MFYVSLSVDKNNVNDV